jgi:small subunit ribosomal protein S3
LRADIDYGIARANTTYGVIGVKVWIFKGEVVKATPTPEAIEPTADNAVSAVK